MGEKVKLAVDLQLFDLVGEEVRKRDNEMQKFVDRCPSLPGVITLSQFIAEVLSARFVDECKRRVLR